MATPKHTRIGIWVIAIVLFVGTIGSFAAMILEGNNSRSDQAQQQKLIEEYKKQMAEQQKKADELSTQYYSQFAPYKTAPAPFDRDTVGDKITTNDVKTGDGAEIKADTNYQAYYVGWNPKGKTFDSSFDGEKLKAPLDVSEGSVIEGWHKGVVGMRVGGVREITIPSDLAYKEQGQGDDIPPNTPIKFIVMVIATK